MKWLDTLSANGDIIFRVKKTDPSGLSKEAKAAIGTRPVYDLSLVYLSGGKETPMGSFVNCRRRLSVSRQRAGLGLHTPVPGVSSKAAMPPDNTAQIFKKGMNEETKLDDRSFIKRLSAVDPEEIIRRGKMDFSTNKAALRFARVILEKYNSQQRGGRKLPYRFKG